MHMNRLKIRFNFEIQFIGLYNAQHYDLHVNTTTQLISLIICMHFDR